MSLRRAAERLQVAHSLLAKRQQHLGIRRLQAPAEDAVIHRHHCHPHTAPPSPLPSLHRLSRRCAVIAIALPPSPFSSHAPSTGMYDSFQHASSVDLLSLHSRQLGQPAVLSLLIGIDFFPLLHTSPSHAPSNGMYDSFQHASSVDSLSLHSRQLGQPFSHDISSFFLFLSSVYCSIS